MTRSKVGATPVGAAPRALLFTVLVTLLVGCTADPAGLGAEEPRQQPTAAPTTPTTEPAAPAPLPPGPLEVYLGYTAEPDSAETIAVRVTWSENLTAACMAEQGFEYVPVVPTPADIRYEDGPAAGTMEHAETYGYGVWAQAPGGFSWEQGENPNDAQVNSLSDAGRSAWETALHGPVVSEESDGSAVRRGGCADAAGTPIGADAAYLVEVRQEAMDFLAVLDEDPRFADVDAAWASCMADAGFTESSPAAARSRVETQLYDSIVDGVAPGAAVAREHATAERLVAVADVRCREATDWTSRHRAIEVTLQQEYVDTHIADLEALLALSTNR